MKQASAGTSTRATSMLQRNMKVSSTPMSAWNLIGEKIQVTTPSDRVRPVNTTTRPVNISA
ncbi:hypothetical protein D3C86_1859630 [compost metagenome]